jgi:ribonuclease R
MSLRDRLLALLRAPDYSPANEFELANRLGLSKKQRAMLAHEVRIVLKAGQFARAQNGRIAARNSEAPAPRVEARPIFTPSRLRGAAPGAPAASAPDASTDRGRPPEHRKDARRSAPTPASTLTKPTLGEDELTGRIQFRAGGSAFVVRDDPASLAVGEPALQVFPEDTGVALPGDRVLAREFPGRKGRKPGEKIGGVVRVLERGRSTVVGDLRRDRRAWIVQPDDPRYNFQILVDDPGKSSVSPTPDEGDKVIVTLHEWKRRTDALTGVLTARLGRTHEPRAEMLGVFEKYNLSPSFPEDVEREAAAIPGTVQPRDLANRLDYREVPTFTIDPDDAKDFDDALSVESLDAGEVRIGIHIADVSAYVRTGSALDKEAQHRGNSTYLIW